LLDFLRGEHQNFHAILIDGFHARPCAVRSG
jgi:hypothetical protein